MTATLSIHCPRGPWLRCGKFRECGLGELDGSPCPLTGEWSSLDTICKQTWLEQLYIFILAQGKTPQRKSTSCIAVMHTDTVYKQMADWCAHYQYELTWLVDGLYNWKLPTNRCFNPNRCLFACAQNYLQTDGLNDWDILAITSTFVYLMIKEPVKLDTIWVLIYFYQDSTQLENPETWKNTFL